MVDQLLSLLTVCRNDQYALCAADGREISADIVAHCLRYDVVEIASGKTCVAFRLSIDQEWQSNLPFTLSKVLGEGNFGLVVVGSRHEDPAQELAIKVQSYTDEEDLR